MAIPPLQLAPPIMMDSWVREGGVLRKVAREERGPEKGNEEMEAHGCDMSPLVRFEAALRFAEDLGRGRSPSGGARLTHERSTDSTELAAQIAKYKNEIPEFILLAEFPNPEDKEIAAGLQRARVLVGTTALEAVTSIITCMQGSLAKES